MVARKWWRIVHFGYAVVGPYKYEWERNLKYMGLCEFKAALFENWITWESDGREKRWAREGVRQDKP